MSKPLEVFAREMRSRRKQEGLSQEGLAEKAGVSMPLVSEMERGIANPTLQTLEKISAYFQTTVSEMLKCEDNSDGLATMRINLIRKILGSNRDELEKISRFFAKL